MSRMTKHPADIFPRPINVADIASASKLIIASLYRLPDQGCRYPAQARRCQKPYRFHACTPYSNKAFAPLKRAIQTCDKPTSDHHLIAQFLQTVRSSLDPSNPPPHANPRSRFKPSVRSPSPLRRSSSSYSTSSPVLANPTLDNENPECL